MNAISHAISLSLEKSNLTRIRRSVAGLAILSLSAGLLGVADQSVAFGAARTEAPTILSQQDFEPSGMGTDPWLQDGSTVASITTANSHGGDWSLALSSQLSGYWVGMSEEITDLTIGRDYTISAWVDASGTTGLSDVSLDVHGVGFDSADTSGWQELSYTFTATDTVQEWSIGNNDATPSSGAVYWDDLSVEQDEYTDGSGTHPAVGHDSNDYELTGFAQVPWLNDGSTIASVTTANSHAGDWSLALSSRLTGYWVGMWDTLTGLVIGKEYTLSAWVDASSTTGLSDISLGIDGGSSPATTVGWQEITYSFTASSTEMDWGFGHNDASPTSGAVYWDDVALSVEGEPLEPAIVLDLSDLSDFADSNAEAIEVDSDTTDVGERTVIGTTFSGDPVQIKVYMTVPYSTSPDDLADLAQNPPTQEVGDPAEVDEETLVPVLATAVTPSTMTFAWEPPDGADIFGVIVDGVSVAEGNAPNFTLRGLNPETVYAIELVSTHSPSDPPASATDLPIDSSMRVSIATPAEPLSLRGGSPSSQFEDPGALVDSTEINYRTFIPYAKLSDSTELLDAQIVEGCIGLDWFDKIPDTTGADFTFLGDDRGFAPPRDGIEDYRTMMDYRVDWEDQSAAFDKNTGATTVYNLTEDEDWATDRASQTNMVFKDRYISESYASVTFSHIANDPFCPSGAVFGGEPGWNPVYDFGAITYSAHFDLFRSGLVIATGIRASMPSHEAYVRWNDQASWTGIFTSNAIGLHCLVLDPVLFYPVCSDLIAATATRSQDRWRDVSSGDATFAVSAQGQTWATGSNAGFVMSPFSEDTACSVETFVPVPVPDGGVPGRVVRAVAADSHGTVVNQSGVVSTWGLPLWSNANLAHAGDGEVGTVGSGSYIDVDVTPDGATTYVVDSNGDLYSWGLRVKDWNIPSADYNYVPSLGPSGFDIVKVRIDSGTVLALDEDGHIWGYGDNAYGLLGTGGSGYTAWDEINVPGVTFVDIALVGNSAFALDSNNQLWEWGRAALALSGVSLVDALDPVYSPTLVDTDIEFERIDDGSGSEVGAIDTNGNLYSWSKFALFDDVEDWELPAWGEDVVLVRDLHAITFSGELLRLDGTQWTDLGLPPTMWLIDPPQTCVYPSRPTI